MGGSHHVDQPGEADVRDRRAAGRVRPGPRLHRRAVARPERRGAALAPARGVQPDRLAPRAPGARRALHGPQPHRGRTEPDARARRRAGLGEPRAAAAAAADARAAGRVPRHGGRAGARAAGSDRGGCGRRARPAEDRRADAAGRDHQPRVPARQVDRRGPRRRPRSPAAGRTGLGPAAVGRRLPRRLRLGPVTRAETRAAERIESDDGARAALQRRVLAVVVAGQVLGGAGLAAGITVGALLAQEMLGSGDLAGVPTALFTLGSALAAFLIGGITQRRGRRLGIGLGFAAGGLGAIGVVVAAMVGSVVLLFVSLFVYGAGTATNLQARYAGTDLALPAGRGKAVSVALVATTVGAVAGPNLVLPLGRFATAVGLPPLSGPFLLAAAAYLAAGAVVFAFLRPDPFLFARRLDERVAVRAGTDGQDRAVPTLGPGVVVGATVM